MSFRGKKDGLHLDKTAEEQTKTQSRLNAIFKELATDDVDGFFFAIENSVEELDTHVEAARQAAERGTDDTDDFYATDLLPASCAVDEEGHMFTAAEVTKALHKEDTTFMRRSSLVRRPSSTRTKNGAQKFPSAASRLSEPYLREGGRSKSFPGIYESRGSPFKWSLSNYLQSVASTREKRIIAVSAWLMALTGLIISLVFVTKDFLGSREELARTIAFEKTDAVELPTLHFCTTGTQLPPFSDLPNGPYQGQPLIWLDIIRGGSLNASIVYPDTRSLPQVRVESFTAAGSRCIALNQMDPAQFESENTRSPSCFHCLTLERDKMFRLEGREGTNARAFSNKLVVRLSQNALVSRCRKSSFGLPLFLTEYFRKVFVHHYMDLKLRGILDYGGYDPQNEAHSYILWPGYRWGHENITRDMRMVDQADMLCNVYMFSGYFYPSTSTGIRYRFNGEKYEWERTGAGPYYPKEFGSIADQPGLAAQSKSAQIGEEVLEDRALYPGQDLFVMTNFSENGVNELLGVVPAEKMAFLQLERNLILGKNESFRSHTILEDVRSGDVKTQADVYVVEVSMLSFLTRVVGKQLSVSWSAFIADFLD
ncbi:hypothetical protein FGB62_24g223 [Gracilaria domingensis]|nr:hypothetical protein FGB62_24g223 [Gracilaria domingensis]